MSRRTPMAPWSGSISASIGGARDSKVVRGAAWVMSGFVIQAVTGVAFWVLSARLYEADEVGAASALFASVQFVNFATAFGLQEMLARHHNLDADLGGALFSWSVVSTVATSVVGSLLYLQLVDPDAAVHLDRLGWWGPLCFSALAAGSALALLVDVMLIAERRWRLVFTRLLVVGVARLPLAWVSVVDSVALRLLVAVSAPIAFSGFVGCALLPRLARRRRSFTLRRIPLAPVRYAAINYVSQLAYLAPQFAIPIMVLLEVPAAENANFFIAWTFVVLLAVLPVTISRVLLSEASQAGVSLSEETRRALVLAVGLMGAALLAGLIGTPAVSWVLGSDYELLVELLPLLLLGGIPAAVSAVLLGHARASDEHLAVVVIPITLALTTLGLAYWTIPSDGGEGAAWAWLVGNSATAAVAVLLLARRPAAAAVRWVVTGAGRRL